jgi:hypothetical protein
MKKQFYFFLLMSITSFSIGQINVTTIPPTGLICVGDTIFMNATGCESYTWQPGNLTGASVYATPITNTTYTVVGTVGANTESTFVSIVVNPLPTVTIMASSTSIETGDSALLIASGLPCPLYTWTPTTNLSYVNFDSVYVSPLVTTIYTVTGCCPGGCPGSETITVNVSLGIANNESEIGIKVSQDHNNNIIVQFKDNIIKNETKATLYDIMGKMLLQKPLEQKRNVLDISPYAKGSYILRIENRDKTFSRQIFKG